MATSTGTTQQRSSKQVRLKESLFQWEGKDKAGKIIRGEMRTTGDAVLRATLRRQGILVTKTKKQRSARGQKIKEKDIAVFTRQLATMMKAGVPLLQAFEISIKGASNPSLSRMLNHIRVDVESGLSLSEAFAKHPAHFDPLFCNLVKAGEQAGILDSLLERLALYKEKILAIKSKIKSALFYPIAVLVVAFIVIAIMLSFVVPEFKKVFEGFGAELPIPTQIVVAVSDAFLRYSPIIFAILFAGIAGFIYTLKRSVPLQIAVDHFILRMPVIGGIIRKATIARWTRTLSTMFAAGVPLFEALDSVGGASGNHIYAAATKKIQSDVNEGTSLTIAMQNSNVFPSMVLQMVSIGEESGQLDSMLSKIADFFEQEVDDAVAGLSQLLEPIIMVFLGVVIGGLVVAMYLPIFKLGSVV